MQKEKVFVFVSLAFLAKGLQVPIASLPILTSAEERERERK
jgi:hypothetical protein